MLPDRPGFYWALWLTADPETKDADDMVASPNWGVVEVFENFLGEPCEADQAEKWGVFVPGVEQVQWLENFEWGERIPQRKP